MIDTNMRRLQEHRNEMRVNTMNRFAANVRRRPGLTGTQHVDLLSNFDGALALFFLNEKTSDKMTVRNMISMLNIRNRADRNIFYTQHIITTDRERKTTSAPVASLMNSFNSAETNVRKHILCSHRTHYMIREEMNAEDVIDFITPVSGYIRAAERRLSLGIDIWRDLGQNPEDLEGFRDTIPDPDDISRIIDDMEITD